MRPGWTAAPTAAVALGAATAKSVLALIAGAADPATIIEMGVSLDAQTGLKIELLESTQASNGTAGTQITCKQTRGFLAGDTTAPTVTAYHTYTSEPTVLTVLKTWYAFSSPFVIQFPLGREVQSLVSGATKYKALILRLTAVAACNAYPYFDFE